MLFLNLQLLEPEDGVSISVLIADIKEYFLDYLPQQKSLQMQTLQLNNQNTDGVK